MKQFDVMKLKGSATDKQGRLTTRGLFQSRVAESLKQEWKEDAPAEGKWNLVKSALCESAESTLGRQTKRSPDWYRESEANLEPLYDKRNQLYLKWLSTGKDGDLKEFRRARVEARQATREAKNAWFLRKAKEAQAGRNGGKIVWKCIRDIQRGRRGLVPVKCACVRDEEGNMCNTPKEQQERWRRHFAKVLNIQSQFDEQEIRKARQRPTRQSLDDPPTADELLSAIGKLKPGKAAGQSGILPEMVQAASEDCVFFDLLMDLVHTVWKEGKVPCDWVDAVLIPIPKKGDLRNCDNWRGIALLDVVGKVVAQILQARLQELAEEVLPESQCGFRKARSCTDMIFTVRQLVEKSWEHKSKSFLSFIDLRKAYDSVPRTAMWLALEKLGVPQKTIQLIRSFHSGMKASICIEGELLDAIGVENGLRQGCCMAPVLFNLYTCLLVECWSARVEEEEGVGVMLKFKVDKKLFRRYTRNAEQRKLTECLFADDGALLASTRAGAVKAVTEYQIACKYFGLMMSIPKTKHMAVGRETAEGDKAPIAVEGGEIESVEEFPYLGSLIASSGTIDTEVESRIAKASRAFGALRKPVFLDKDLTLLAKRKVYNACVLSVLLYGSECWTPLKRHVRKINSFHHRCIRTILGISNREQWPKHITMAEIRKRWGDNDTASDMVTKRRLQWLGHLARMNDSRIPKTTLFGWLCQPRPQSGPRKRWRDVVRRDLKDIKIAENEWYDEATTSRSGWRAMCRERVESCSGQQVAALPASPSQSAGRGTNASLRG